MRITALLKSTPPTPPVGAKVCVAVQVGLIAWESAGAASERTAVVALPLTAVRPREALGLAKPLKFPGCPLLHPQPRAAAAILSYRTPAIRTGCDCTRPASAEGGAVVPMGGVPGVNTAGIPNGTTGRGVGAMVHSPLA